VDLRKQINRKKKRVNNVEFALISRAIWHIYQSGILDKVFTIITSLVGQNNTLFSQKKKKAFDLERKQSLLPRRIV
jgi:hypothetical protein